MIRSPKNYYVTSARFNGRGRGFVVGFDSRRAAYAFAAYCLFGFADVLEWWEFQNRYPNYKSEENETR